MVWHSRGWNTWNNCRYQWSQHSESSPAIHVSGKGDLTIIDSNFARSSGSDPLIQIDANSNSEVHISDSLFSDSGSQCIYAQGESSMLHLRDVTMQRCGGDGAYIRSTSVDIDGLEVTDVEVKDFISQMF